MTYKDYYKKEYYSGNYSITENRKEEIINKVKKLHLVSPILEIGCSDGFLVDYLNKDFEAYGIDILTNSKNCLSINIEEEINPERTYNTILMFDVLEHLFDYDKALENISKLTKQNGLIYIHIPHVFSLKNRIKFLFGIDVINNLEEKGHIRFYSINFLTKLLNKYGFKVLEIKGFGKLKIPSLCGSILIIGVKK